jgi:hypothetical protein
MQDPDIEKLLERNLAGNRAPELFRERLLRDSAAALGRTHVTQAWRCAACVAAAVLIAAMSFLWGRASASRPAAAPVAANSADTVSVPVDLVAWLEAARFFKQLDMPERVALAYDRAGRLIPYDSLQADADSRTTLAASVKQKYAILAQSLGD